MSVSAIRILLVEDNPGDARLVKEALTGAGQGSFQLTHAADLGSALEGLRRETYDVVLLDLGLPDSQGLETLSTAHGEAPEVPIVVLTGLSDETLGVEAVKSGAQDYLFKGHIESRLLARSVRYAIERQRVEEELGRRATALAKAEEAQRARRRIIAAQEALRREIASHLHGRVQGRLLALRGMLQLAAMKDDLSPETSKVMGQVVEGISEVVEQEISVLSRQLYPSILRLGITPALQSLGDQFRASLTVDVEIDEGLERLAGGDRTLVPEPVRLAAFRIAESALNNVVKHAQASRATVRLERSSEQWLWLTVGDDGRGFDVESVVGGLGLAEMGDYAESVGGECVIHSAPGRGTEITATLCLDGASGRR